MNLMERLELDHGGPKSWSNELGFYHKGNGQPVDSQQSGIIRFAF